MKKLKEIALFIWSVIIMALSYVLIVLDRFAMALFVNVELPNAKEINKFEHYRNQLARRTGYYLVISMLCFVVFLGYQIIIYSF